MHAFRCGYRHDDGQVDGFTGYGFSEYSARKDCAEQVCRRLSAVSGTPQAVDIGTLLFSERDFTPDEMEKVRQDWARGLRYAPGGSLYPG